MNVVILNVQQKGGLVLNPPRQYLFGVSRLSNVAKQTLTSTRVLFRKDTRWASSPELLIVEGDYQTIQQSITGIVNSGSIVLTPNTLNGKPITTPVLFSVDAISFGVQDGSKSILFVQNDNRIELDRYEFNSTVLEDLATTINQSFSNIDFSGAFGSCTTSTQAITYNINQNATLKLQVFNGITWIDVDQDVISAGSGSHTFSFYPGDIVSGQEIRVVGIVNNQIYPVIYGTYACTGGSASGSGTSGDCNMYAYFDGEGWDNTDKTLNWGATCTQGYQVQISTSPDFTNQNAIVADFQTTATIYAFPSLPNGTYYARVRNIAGATRYSPTLTFTKS